MISNSCNNNLNNNDRIIQLSKAHHISGDGSHKTVRMSHRIN